MAAEPNWDIEETPLVERFSLAAALLVLIGIAVLLSLAAPWS
jgi:hypothetical protein